MKTMPSITRAGRRWAISLIICALAVLPAPGQQMTGFPNFSSFTSQVDTIDNANQNIHFDIPVFSRPGRGIPFSYSLTYDSLVWSQMTSGTSKMWMSDANWGWGSVSQAQVGYISYQRSTLICDSVKTRTYSEWANFSYVDAHGTPHPFGIAVGTDPTGCGSGESSSDTELSLDGAGFTLTVTVVQGNTIQTTLRNRSGMKIVAPVSRAGSGSLTDTNGNRSA